MLTANATYENSGSMQDYMKFLMSNAEERGNSSIHYRCYCTVLHEYNNFDWYDENYTPHIISECDAFVEYTGETEQVLSQGPAQRMIQRSNDAQLGQALKPQRLFHDDFIEN